MFTGLDRDIAFVELSGTSMVGDIKWYNRLPKESAISIAAHHVPE
jgi:hypothetical protein